MVQRIVSTFSEDLKVLDFQDYAPAGSTVASVRRLDTDADTQQEWVVCYQYDIVGNRNPVSCVIYDVEGAGAPVIYPYGLRTPGSDYLGENQVSIVMEDILQDMPDSGAPMEMILTDGTTLSVFGVKDVSPAVAGPCIVYPNPYENLGFFKASLRVQRSGKTISVWDQGGNERSQFALKRVYLPSAGQYFFPGTSQLLPPVEASIEFAYGMPSDILDTPYPEKLVLAFYKELLTGDVTPYLSEQGRDRFRAGRLDFGSPWSLAQTTKVLVQEISYAPMAVDAGSAVTRDPEAEVAQIQVKARFWGPGGEERLRQILWHVVREGSRWKLHEAISRDA